MFDFDKLEKIIAEKSQLAIDIKKLIAIILTQKKFVFNSDEIGFDIQELTNKGIVKIDGDKIKLTENDLISYAAYIELSKIKGYSVSAEPEKLFEFFQSVRDHFNSGNHIGITQFLRGVFKLGVYHQHYLFTTDMLQYSKTWKKEPYNPLYIFNEAFGEFLPYHKYNLDTLLQTLRRLYELLQDKEVMYNLDLGRLGGGIRKYASINPQQGKELLMLLMNNYDEINENISISVITGLLENDRVFFSEVDKMAENEIYQPAIVVSLATQGVFSEADAETILDITERIKNTSLKYLTQLPQLFTSIIKNEHVHKPEIYNRCFEELRKLIVQHDDVLPPLVLHEIRFIKNHEEEKVDLLISLINEAEFKSRLLPAISFIFFDFKSPKLYFNFLLAYADKFKFQSDEEIFEHGLPDIRDKNASEFDEILIQCLTHDKGERRWMGIRVFTKISFFYGVSGFAYNVLALDPKTQFKIITSILSGIMEPKYILPFVLPFANSLNEVVRELLACRLEVLSEDYGSEVPEAINRFWPDKSEAQQTLFNRIVEYNKNFGQLVKTKLQIKELNPLYTQANHFNAYMSTYTKVFRRSITENVDKKSFFKQIATTVILARGGGWKHQETGEVTQLGSVGSSFALPRSLLLSPDNFEWTRRVEQIENWKNFLAEWQVTI